MKKKFIYEELQTHVEDLEKKLRDAETLTEDIMTYMTEGLVLTDTRGIVIFINQRLSEMLGYLPEEVVGKSWLDMVPVEQQTIAREVEARRARGYTDRYEIILRRKEGQQFPVMIGAGPRFDKQTHEFVGTMGVVTDITEHRIAEQALHEKTQFLHNIIDTTPDLVAVTDMEGNFKFTGPSSITLGYDPDSFIGRNVMEFVHPDDSQAIAAAFADFLASPEDSRKAEFRYRRADGDYLWLETVGKFILDDAGNPKEILFISRDLTAHKLAERELKRIEWMLSRKPVSSIEAQTEAHDQGYGDLTALNQDGIILKSIGHEHLKRLAGDYLDLLGTSSAIFEVNGDYAFKISVSGWCRMMDRASRNLCDTSDNVEALNSGRWLCHESCWTDCAQKAITTCAPVDIECNGGMRMYAVPVFAGGNVIGAINFGYGDLPRDPDTLRRLADVYHLNPDDLLCEAAAYDSRPLYMIEMAKKRLSSTAKLIGSMVETKQAMAALQESECRFKALHDTSFGGIAIHDQGVILECNQCLSKMTGYEYSELIGMDGLLLIAEKSRKKVMNNIRAGYEKPYEASGVHKNGEEFPVRLEARNVPYKGKQVRTVELRDITEQKRAEAENEQLQAQLRQAQRMESVGRLAGGVAHDFNNMLGVILGHTELALLKTDEDSNLVSDLNEIQKAAKRSADITKQLLAFARKQIISPRQIDLNDTVASMLNMLGRLIGEDIDLIWQPGTHLWSVKMDPTQIDQILANLCVNARDAISGVGKLTIETGKKTFDETYCNDHPGFIPGDFVLLAVSDNGCGMDKNILDNLFEPFFTTKEVGKGTGLGLATIYGIVKQNNGFINVYSEPGNGSIFKIYLPRHIAENDAGRTVFEKKAAARGTETILLVEDEPTILRMTRLMLERQGYSVLPAATPGEAINLIKIHADKIHLLMTDVVMPEMNGRDLARQITAICPGIKLLFMSGYTSNVIARQGVLDDGGAFIQKPFSMADMTAKVRKVLDKDRCAGQAALKTNRSCMLK